MGQFTYNEDKTEAKVNFQAHKFPYTASVYYQCNVRLCVKHDAGCSNTVIRNSIRPVRFARLKSPLILPLNATADYRHDHHLLIV